MGGLGHAQGIDGGALILHGNIAVLVGIGGLDEANVNLGNIVGQLLFAIVHDHKMHKILRGLFV